MLATLALSLLLAAAVLAVAGMLYQQHGLRQDRRKHLPPGRLVSAGDRRLYVYQTGEGEPAVVFESGLVSSSLTWNAVQQLVERTTRAISYDRAGIGWSEETKQRGTVAGMVTDLSALLRASGNSPPYILVGHSFGSLLARAYASFKSEEVAGLVLVDPVSLDLWADCSKENERRLHLGARLSRRGVLLANLGVVRLALAALASGRTRLPKAIAKASAGKAMGAIGRLTGVVGKLPPSLRPIVQSYWSQAKSFRTLAEYLEILPECAIAARGMAVPATVPITILSGGNATADELNERERWVEASLRGRHRQIPESGHWIHLEHPEQVGAAVLDMVAYVRGERHLETHGD